MTKRIMILSTNGFEQSELEKPKANLEAQGFETVVVSPESGSIKGWDGGDWGNSVSVDKTIDEISSIDEYDALLLPGGQMNPDILRMNDDAVKIVKDFGAAGKPVAAICHAPWLLIDAGLAKGKNVTSWPSIRADLSNAGANVSDEEVVVDGNIITSRKPEDIAAFSAALLEKLGTTVEKRELESA